MIVIFNPTAGRRRSTLLNRVLGQLTAAGAAITLHPTTCAGDAEAIAARLSPPDDGLVVAAGGDGTIAEVVNGLLANPSRDALRLGVIPLGTANVLAHEIALSAHPNRITKTLLEGRIMPVYPGLIRHTDGTTRAFLMMVGAGFDAAVVAAVTPTRKRRLGKGAYVLQTLQCAATRTFPTFTVEVNGQTLSAQSIVICNGCHYGGPYRLAPAANLSQPEFQVVVLSQAGGWHALRQGLHLILGTMSHAPGVRILPAHQITIDSRGPLQADGDPAGVLPATITTTQQALSLMVPDTRHS
ncbi:MAG: diacylglycerol kinase family lipid kinase [Rhodospirillaceae bacterium]|nr:diacylglycerol kinase family lipid kinase [Rhodospirillaceae bacterium]